MFVLPAAPLRQQEPGRPLSAFDGATEDPIQQAVRDALIAFMADVTGASRSHESRSAGRY
jgi:hypothetical protein